ncbi:MAG: hypothetical protein AB4080_20585 [Trichodesmium sp.]
MNSAINHSHKTNKSQISHEAHPSEETIKKSDIKQTLSRTSNGRSSESEAKLINESVENNMAKDYHQGTNTLTVTDTKESTSSKSNNQPQIETDTPSQNSTIVRQHPIAPPSEPKQYRAIGLVQGRYQSSTEQFTRGSLHTPDGSEIDAVLLGRVMSLLKNHLDLESEHLWVVYPRTRQEDDDLHLQIMGVWEPETLRKIKEPSTDLTNEEQDQSSSSIISDPTTEDEQCQETVVTEDIDNSQETTVVPNSETEIDSFFDLNDGYFSIRGEVIYQSQEEEYVIVKVQQSPRKGEETPKFFKLKLKGYLGDRPLNRFWDLHIQRQNTSLVIQYANDIGSLFVNNRRPSPSTGRKTFSSNNSRRRNSYPQASRTPRPQSNNSTNSTPVRKEALPKPTKRNKSPEN